ncbi:hypothetical protein A8990_105106 [Paenibacillus taihuensis]|uniref:Uncharacterized protein n=1 Tax=Paenibacillus taihuensis TaxID=1156355 RepID=A0A3D9SBZ0_9BACL|nr:hypothetical protein [Paenibacillus taihuensis]REE91401.1 hypothetical protein A8990_105106 [Paenibacillus taihuensis]
MGLITDEPFSKATDQPFVSVVNLSIYGFDSEAERVKGRKDFEAQMSARTALDELHPGIYEHNNVLVIYFRDNDTEDIVNSDIREALEEL